MVDDAKETYLGDGLYASFDGFQFCLRAPRMEGDDVVFLEPGVLDAFTMYVERALADARELAEKGDV